VIVVHQNATHELLESRVQDWPEAQPYLLMAGPLQVGALPRANLETFFQQGRYRLYLTRQKSDNAIVASVLVQLTGCQQGLMGILHFLHADDSYESYALEFVQKIEAILADQPLRVARFTGMARAPFHKTFLENSRFSLGEFTLNFGYVWPDAFS